MAQQWYWTQNGQRNGPVDTAELKELARSGRLRPTDMIWREGLPNWVSATQAKGLFQDQTSVAGGIPASTPAPPMQPGSAELGKIQFQCSECGKGVSAPVEKAGKSGKCPSCGTAITIPVPAPPIPAKQETEERVSPVIPVLDAMASEDYPLAMKHAQEVLQTPNCTSEEYGFALGVIGFIHKLAERFSEAQTYLEKAFNVGCFQGPMLEIVAMYADALGDVYDRAIQVMFSKKETEQAKTLCSKLSDLIARFRSYESFKWIKHEGILFLSEGMIAADCTDWENALQAFQRILEEPYKEYFAGGFRFVVGMAYENIGRYYFLVAYRVKESIPYFEEALRYYDQGDSQFQSVQALLADAKSQAASSSELPALPLELKEKLDSLRFESDDTRLDVFEEIPTDLPREYFRAVQGAVMQAMTAGGPGVRMFGAVTLARLGDESYSPISILLGNLSPPPTKDESQVKRLALQGLSYVKGREDVVEKLIEVTQQDKDVMVRQRAIFALAATGNPAARQFVEGLAGTGDRAALFALEWVNKDVDSLRDAIINGHKDIPGAALSVFAGGWNGLPWGATVAEFRRRFPEASFDDIKWETGEGEEELAGVRMITGYMFNKKGHLFLVSFDPGAGEEVDWRPLQAAFGMPDGVKRTSWSCGSVILNARDAVVVLVNTAFDDDPLSWEKWMGKKRDRR